MALADFLTERGKKMCEQVFGAWQRPSSADNGDPEYQQLVANFVHNGMYSREVLPQATRELLAVACLTALYRPEELRSHIRAALRLAPPEQVREAIQQAGVYGGFPAAMNGLRIFAELTQPQETRGSA